MALGIALNQLRQQGQGNALLSPDRNADCCHRARNRSVGRRAARHRRRRVLDSLHGLGDELDALHTDVHEHLWSVFRMRVALLIVVSFLERYRGYFQPADLEGVPVLAH